MLIKGIKKQIVGELQPVLPFPSAHIENALSLCTKPDVGDFVLMMQKISRDSIDLVLISKRLEFSPIVQSVTVSGSTLFIKLDKKKLLKSFLVEIYEGKYKDELLSVGTGKNVVIEYSSPNIAKIFHAGHLRTTMIGNFLKNLYRKFGYNVTSINYLGDWGKQFGLVGYYFFEKMKRGEACLEMLEKAVENVEKKKSASGNECSNGHEKNTDKDDVSHNTEKKNMQNVDDVLKYFFNIYVEVSRKAKEDPNIDKAARVFFKEMEDGKPENIELWRNIRELSIRKYKEVYEMLGVHFDVYSGESEYGKRGKEIITGSSAVSTDNDGSKVIDLGKLGKLIVIKGDGTTLYQTRDIAAVFDRVEKYNPEKILYVVATEQSDYLAKLGAAVKKLGIERDVVEHVEHGMVMGMSSRKGTVVFLEDIINDTKKAMLDTMKKSDRFECIDDVDETALVLAVSGIIVQDFGAKRRKDYTFSISRCTSIEGNTGPYLQYTHCRMSSIEKRNEGVSIESSENIDYSCIEEELVLMLAFHLVQYPIVLLECLETHEPHILLEFVMKLAKYVNRMFGSIKVVGSNTVEIARARLLVYLCAKNVLGDGMKILGLKPLDRM
eukprot:jgi/Antlo1/692/603